MEQSDLRLRRGAILLIRDDRNKREIMLYESNVAEGTLDVTGALCVRGSTDYSIGCMGFRINQYNSPDMYLDLSRFILLYPAPDEDAYINRMEEVNTP